MTTFAQLLNDSMQLLEMSAELNAEFTAQKHLPVVIPDTAKGEEKIPVVKPNGITR
jgi:hypothetical protein